MYNISNFIIIFIGKTYLLETSRLDINIKYVDLIVLSIFL